MAASSTPSDRRRVLAELVRDRDAGGSTARTMGRVIAVLLVLAILALLGLWLAGFFGVAPAVREIRGLVDVQIEELRRIARNEAPLSYD